MFHHIMTSFSTSSLKAARTITSGPGAGRMVVRAHQLGLLKPCATPATTLGGDILDLK
jgi:hypothetical protein